MGQNFWSNPHVLDSDEVAKLESSLIFSRLNSTSLGANSILWFYPSFTCMEEVGKTLIDALKGRNTCSYTWKVLLVASYM